MTGGGPKPAKDVDSLVENGKDLEQGGGEAVFVRIFLLSRHSIDVSIWHRYVGGYLLHGTVYGGFPRPGGVATDMAFPKWSLYKKWKYTMTEAASAEAGFEPMETYIWRSHNVV